MLRLRQAADVQARRRQAGTCQLLRQAVGGKAAVNQSEPVATALAGNHAAVKARAMLAGDPLRLARCGLPHAPAPLAKDKAAAQG